MELDNTYSVYMHVNKTNGKKYIGITALEPTKRWEKGHGYRKSPYFYNAIKKYGWDGFHHYVLFTGLSKQMAENLEIMLIEQYRATDDNFGYNMNNGGSCAGKHSEQTRKKMRLSKKGTAAGSKNPMYGKIGFKNPCPHRREVKQYSIYGEYIKTFGSIGEAKRAVGAANGCIEKCCNKQFAYAYGYIWRYADDTEPVKPYDKIVVQYDLDGNEIARFLLAADASRATGVPLRGISSCLEGRNVTAGGYRWGYYGKPLRSERSTRKEVIKYDKDMNELARYPSAYAAAVSEQFDRSLLTRVCRRNKERSDGEYLSYKGYIWKYSEG